MHISGVAWFRAPANQIPNAKLIRAGQAMHYDYDRIGGEGSRTYSRMQKKVRTESSKSAFAVQESALVSLAPSFENGIQVSKSLRSERSLNFSLMFSLKRCTIAKTGVNLTS